MYYFFGGKIRELSELSIEQTLPGLFYGHSVFTSFSSFEGRIYAWHRHLERLMKGATTFFCLTEKELHQMREEIERDFLLLQEILLRNEDYSFRITLIPKKNAINHHDISWKNTAFPLMGLISFKKREGVNFLFKEKKAPRVISLDENELIMIKGMRGIDGIKRANYSNFIPLLKKYPEDEILFEKEGFFWESPSSNIVFISSERKKIFLMPRKEQIVEGIMQDIFCEKFIAENPSYRVVEKKIRRDELKKEKIDFMFLTNCVEGIKKMKIEADEKKKCLQCKNEIKEEGKRHFFPFCSKRCKMLDLGKWFNEEYAMPTEESEDAFEENIHHE